MSRFRTLAAGTAARKTVSFSLPGCPETQVDLRPLTTAEEIDALEQALKIAKDRGVAEPREGQAIYDLALMASVLLRGVLDHESPANDPQPFFDELGQPLSLDRDRLVYLYEAHCSWQEHCSPRQMSLTTEQYIAFVAMLASGEGALPDPFGRWPQATLVTCMRTLARQLLNSPVPNSHSSLPSVPISSINSGPTESHPLTSNNSANGKLE